MKARVHTDFHTTAGTIAAGTVLEGEEAMRFLTAGLALPVVEEAKVETAEAKKAKVETR